MPSTYKIEGEFAHLKRFQNIRSYSFPSPKHPSAFSNTHSKNHRMPQKQNTQLTNGGCKQGKSAMKANNKIDIRFKIELTYLHWSMLITGVLHQLQVKHHENIHHCPLSVHFEHFPTHWLPSSWQQVAREGCFKRHSPERKLETPKPHDFTWKKKQSVVIKKKIQWNDFNASR